MASKKCSVCVQCGWLWHMYYVVVCAQKYWWHLTKIWEDVAHTTYRYTMWCIYTPNPKEKGPILGLLTSFLVIIYFVTTATWQHRSNYYYRRILIIHIRNTDNDKKASKLLFLLVVYKENEPQDGPRLNCMHQPPHIWSSHEHTKFSMPPQV